MNNSFIDLRIKNWISTCQFHLMDLGGIKFELVLVRTLLTLINKLILRTMKVAYSDNHLSGYYTGSLRQTIPAAFINLLSLDGMKSLVRLGVF